MESLGYCFRYLFRSRNLIAPFGDGKGDVYHVRLLEKACPEIFLAHLCGNAYERCRIKHCISNPRHCSHNDALARLVTRLLITRMGESRLQHHLKELCRSNYRHILSSMAVGLWTIRIPSDGRPPQLVADETMYRALGAPTSPRFVLTRTTP